MESWVEDTLCIAFPEKFQKIYLHSLKENTLCEFKRIFVSSEKEYVLYCFWYGSLKDDSFCILWKRTLSVWFVLNIFWKRILSVLFFIWEHFLWCSLYYSLYDSLQENKKSSLHFWKSILVRIILRKHSQRKPDLKYLDLQIRVVFLDTLLSEGDSVYSRENLFVILGTPEKTRLICMGPVKTCWKLWQSGRVASAAALALGSLKW